MALLVIALFLAIRPLWKQWKQWVQWRKYRSATTSTTLLSIEERKYTILEFARLMLLLSAAATIFLFVTSPSAAVRPWSTRYLVGLLIALPAVLWPLWQGIRAVPIKHLTSKFARFTLALRSSIVVLIGAVFLIGTIAIFTLVPSIQALNQQDIVVTHDLSQAGITHIYSDYWTCDRLIFLTQEHLICGVVDDATTGPGLNRYTPYYTEVQADPHSAYVFVAGSSYVSAFELRIAANATRYRKMTFDGYMVYVPILT